MQPAKKDVGKKDAPKPAAATETIKAGDAPKLTLQGTVELGQVLQALGAAILSISGSAYKGKEKEKTIDFAGCDAKFGAPFHHAHHEADCKHQDVLHSSGHSSKCHHDKHRHHHRSYCRHDHHVLSGCRHSTHHKPCKDPCTHDS